MTACSDNEKGELDMPMHELTHEVSISEQKQALVDLKNEFLDKQHAKKETQNGKRSTLKTLTKRKKK